MQLLKEIRLCNLQNFNLHPHADRSLEHLFQCELPERPVRHRDHSFSKLDGQGQGVQQPVWSKNLCHVVGQPGMPPHGNDLSVEYTAVHCEYNKAVELL